LSSSQVGSLFCESNWVTNVGFGGQMEGWLENDGKELGFLRFKGFANFGRWLQNTGMVDGAEF